MNQASVNRKADPAWLFSWPLTSIASPATETGLYSPIPLICVLVVVFHSVNFCFMTKRVAPELWLPEVLLVEADITLALRRTLCRLVMLLMGAAE